jgi:outer membrane receptor for ferrienterochelin and colicin
VHLTASLIASANATLMQARIADYTDDASGESFHDVAPLLTPRVISAQRLEWRPTALLSFWGEARYTGRSQLDNTGNPSLILPAAYVLDASAVWRFASGRHALELRGNNLTNSKRYGSGYGSGDTPYYYVLPPRNLFVTLKLGF